MHPSLFSNVIRGNSPEEVAAKTAALGLRSVQLIPAWVEVGFGFDHESAGAGAAYGRWAAAYRAEGVDICGLGGYINLLHHDPERRRANIETFKGALRAMGEIGTRWISTETGTYARSGDWDHHPDNRTPEAWDDLRRVTDELLEVAAAEDVVILYEPYIVNVCHSPQLGARLLEEVGSPHLGLLMDPTNWFEPEDARPERVAAVIDAGFEAERGRFHLAHAKDVTPGSPKPGLPGPGQGILDYPRYLRRLREHGYDGPLIIEHLTEDEVPEAVAFIEEQLAAPAREG
jgi:sugar phosphate isomerase/epimerase